MSRSPTESRPAAGAGDRAAPQVVTALKGSAQYAAWVGELSDHQRLRVAELVDQALVHYAKHVGFEKPAPPRHAKR